jgi:hypothetical protein
MSEHRWYLLPPSTTTDATRYEACQCGAKRIYVHEYAGTAMCPITPVWISGPHECPLAALREDEDG